MTWAGHRVLINGASGSVGTFAVQLAKYFGAHVIGVCSTRNVALVQSLGADQVIDYTHVDWTKNAAAYDIIFDAVGTTTFAQCNRVLKPNGYYLHTGPGRGSHQRVVVSADNRKACSRRDRCSVE